METRHRVEFGSAGEMSFVDDAVVDLVVTSPPYPMIEMWDAVFSAQDPAVDEKLAAADGAGAFEAMHRVLDRVWKQCARVVRPGGFLCINIGDATRKLGDGFRLYTNHSRITSKCEALGFESLPAVVWRKQTNAPNKFMGSGMFPSGAYVTLEHEYILILRKGGKRVFTATEKDRRHRSAFFWEERNSWFSDIWDFKGTRQKLGLSDARARSGAFPFELAFRLINMYSMQEDTVLDPFLGTGTTTIAAIAADRNSIGVEIDATLQPVIRDAVLDAAGTINDRQLERIARHREFVEQSRSTNRALGHQNAPHGFPVVTRQERDLTIPVVTEITALEPFGFRASHEPYDGQTITPALDGIDAEVTDGDGTDAADEVDQLGLPFAE